MDLSSLKPACGSTHHEKRIGRGQGSGKGGTSTRVASAKKWTMNIPVWATA